MPSDAGTVPCSTSSMTLSSDALGSHAIPCRATALNEAADHEWLRDLCRAPRTVRETAGACHAQAHAPDQEQAAADEADWDWLRSLCRAPRTALENSSALGPLCDSLETRAISQCAKAGLLIHESGGIPDCHALAKEFERCKAGELPPPAHVPQQGDLEKRQEAEQRKREEEEKATELAKKNDVCLAMKVKHVFPDWNTLGVLRKDDAMRTEALQRGPAAAAFAGARVAVEQRLQEIGVAVFKLGIATWPIDRFRAHAWSYAYEGFTEMALLMASTATECRRLERMLIATFRERRGCFNEAPGGEGMRDSENLCYAYCVFADAGTGRPLVRRRRVALLPGGA